MCRTKTTKLFYLKMRKQFSERYKITSICTVRKKNDYYVFFVVHLNYSMHVYSVRSLAVSNIPIN